MVRTQLPFSQNSSHFFSRKLIKLLSNSDNINIVTLDLHPLQPEVAKMVSNQITGINRITALGGYKSAGDGVYKSGTAAYCGNPKKVYDSSDYIKYRKLKAENRNYNDKAFGGDESHSTFTAINHIRRF